jgi:hypothetical protein
MELATHLQEHYQACTTAEHKAHPIQTDSNCSLQSLVRWRTTLEKYSERQWQQTSAHISHCICTCRRSPSVRVDAPEKPKHLRPQVFGGCQNLGDLQVGGELQHRVSE